MTRDAKLNAALNVLHVVILVMLTVSAVRTGLGVLWFVTGYEAALLVRALVNPVRSTPR